MENSREESTSEFRNSEKDRALELAIKNNFSLEQSTDKCRERCCSSREQFRSAGARRGAS